LSDPVHFASPKSESWEGWLRRDRDTALVGDVMTADHDGFEKICLIAGATEDAGFRGAGDVEETAGHTGAVTAGGVVSAAAQLGVRLGCMGKHLVAASKRCYSHTDRLHRP
jgi:hypothetical protein